MAENTGHAEWVRRQFKNLKGKKPSYRNALLHASFIESIVRNKGEGKPDDFYHANQRLLNNGEIIKDEWDIFNAVRDTRNNLAHDILKGKAPQKLIEEWRDDLMEKILDAYTSSSFLKRELFEKYGMNPDHILEPAPKT